MSSPAPARRVLSGMRPTGRLHLGNYHGALRNWVELQYQYECFFFVADWHMLTTGYEDTAHLQEHVREVLIDWLAAGLNPGVATLFIQSHVPEHAELHLLLSMITPLGWLERVPSYKDQQEQLKEKDLATYGFLGYPLLQSADILVYRAAFVPVGRGSGGARGAHARDRAALQPPLRARAGFRGQGRARREEPRRPQHHQLPPAAPQDSRKPATSRRCSARRRSCRATTASRSPIASGCSGFLEGTGVSILPEPQVLLTATPKVPGLDGRKMSKSYGNTIGLREEPDEVVKKLRAMQTDPARVRRTDPGDPEKCPVWDLHKIYSDEATRKWVQRGLPHRRYRLPGVQAAADREGRRGDQRHAQARTGIRGQPELVRSIVAEGAEKAREAARQTLDEVRRAMHLRAD